MTSDDPIDQTRLPWAVVPGEPAERVLRSSEYEAWALARVKRCGHQDPARGCRTCAGTMAALEGLGQVGAVRLYPAV